jgi:hypothetical protein
VLEQSPGIQLVTADVDVDLNSDFLRVKINELFRKLFEEKSAHVPSVPLQGLGVTRACRSTGLPAVGLGSSDDESYSAEVLAKQRAAGPAHSKLSTDIPPPQGFAYPKEFDNLGRSEGSQSYMAVVHADGNSMGRRIRAIGTGYDETTAMRKRNRRYIREIRAFSEAVDDAALDAQRTVLDRLEEGVDDEAGIIRHAVRTNDANGEHEIARVELEPASNGDDADWLLPFRPLVYGGDDLTFVCDGRLGIALALQYVREFEKETESRKEKCGGEAITASAGVAIVKTHYPFARAYDLAEELTQSAKQLRRAAQDENEDWDHACLDWHFALGGLAGSLEQIRRREYRALKKPGGARLPLTLRPVAVDASYLPPIGGRHFEPEAQKWEVVADGIEAFQDPDWQGRRNKLKRLREALRKGAPQVKAFTDALSASTGGERLPALPLSGGDVEETQKNGWVGKRCAYFDALELSDFFIPEKEL